MKPPILTCIVALLLLTACGESEQIPDSSPETLAAQSGSLSFVANGEDIVRQGFVSKDGWRITFDHVYLTLADVAAYQTTPPYDAASGVEPEGVSSTVEGPITVDLAAGDENSAPLLIETVDAPVGQYNALGWRMIPASAGAASGATISLVGTAEKSGKSLNFTLNDSTEYAYNCGEYVGDLRKGILTAETSENAVPNAVAEVEATFHFDHIFGNADAPPDDALNVGALGFDPLAALAQDGQLETTVTALEDLLDAEAYRALVNALATLGHVGEGHCYEAIGGYTGHNE